MTCPRPQRNVHRPWYEPGTPWSEIRRPNHCTTAPPCLKVLNILYMDVQKSVIPRPGLEPRISCVPGRRANHCTTAAPDLYANFSIYKPLTSICAIERPIISRRRRPYYFIFGLINLRTAASLFYLLFILQTYYFPQ